MRTHRIATIVLAFLALGTAFAAEGKIPILAPIVITTSGSYVLAKDLTVASGSAITIKGNPTVVLDLAGHVIVSTAGPAITIDRNGTQTCASLTMRNGNIASAGIGVTTTGFPSCNLDVRIEGVRFRNADVYVEDGNLFVSSSRFVASDLTVDANFTGVTAQIYDNAFTSGGISVLGGTSVEVRHNTIWGGAIVAQASDGWDVVNNLIEGNAITYGGIEICPQGSEHAQGLVVARNVVWGAILVRNASGFRLSENTTKGCTEGGAAIDVVASARGLIEGNHTDACAYGLKIDADSVSNVYRGNIFKDSTLPVLDGGSSNVDAGGNVY